MDALRSETNTTVSYTQYNLWYLLQARANHTQKCKAYFIVRQILSQASSTLYPRFSRHVTNQKVNLQPDECPWFLRSQRWFSCARWQASGCWGDSIYGPHCQPPWRAARHTHSGGLRSQRSGEHIRSTQCRIKTCSSAGVLHINIGHISRVSLQFAVATMMDEILTNISSFQYWRIS